MYTKSEISWILIIVCILALAQTNVSYLSDQETNPLPLSVYLVLNGLFLLIFILFYKLTVKVGNNKIQLLYGIGIIRINIKPRVIREIQVVKTPWYYGLGIRITPQGMLYNAHTLKAIKLTFEDDKPKTVLIGSPEPELLKQAIEQNFRS